MDLNILSLIRAHTNDRHIISLCRTNHLFYNLLKVILSNQKHHALSFTGLNLCVNLKRMTDISYASSIQRWFLCVQSEQDLQYLHSLIITNLKLSLSTKSIQYTLPSTLKTLEIVYAYHQCDEAITQNASELISFTLHYKCLNDVRITFEWHTHRFALKVDQNNDIHLTLPQTLTSLTILGENIVSIEGSYGTLKYVHLAHQHNIVITPFIEYFHVESNKSSITWGISHNSYYDQVSCPIDSKLHTLIIPTMKYGPISLLPESLTHLDISNYVDEINFPLPAQLKYLAISNFNSKHPLPIHLEMLKIRDCEPYAALPLNLKQIHCVDFCISKMMLALHSLKMKKNSNPIHAKMQVMHEVHNGRYNPNLELNEVHNMHIHSIHSNDEPSNLKVNILMSAKNEVFSNLCELRIYLYKEDKINFGPLKRLKRLHIDVLSCSITLFHVKEIHINQAICLPTWCNTLRIIELRTYNETFKQPFPERLKHLILPCYDRSFDVPLPRHLRVLHVHQLHTHDIPFNIREIIES